MSQQKWDRLYRTLSVETAQIYKTFFEIVIEDGGKISDVEKFLQKHDIIRSQSTITKIIRSLNVAVKVDAKYDAVSRNAFGNWSKTKIGLLLYGLCCRLISTVKEEIKEIDRADKRPHIHIAYSTFGLPFVYSIKRECESHVDHTVQFELEYTNTRTRDIPYILAQKINADFALGESLEGPNDSGYDENLNSSIPKEEHFESVVVDREAIVILSNQTLPNGRVPISDTEARKLRVKTADQGIMLKFLASVYRIDLQTDILDRSAANRLSNLGVNFVEPLYNDVHSLIDSFILDSDEAIVFAGETVVDQIVSRATYLNKSDGGEHREAKRYTLYNMKNQRYLYKRLYRRKRDQDRFEDNHPYTEFWNAAQRKQEQLISTLN